MNILKSKTVAYLAVFLTTLSVVAVTLALQPAPVVHGGNVDADAYCEHGKDGKIEDKYKDIAALSSKSDALEGVVSCYHDTVNKMFNAKVHDLVKLSLAATKGPADANVGNAAQNQAQQSAATEQALKELVEKITPVAPDAHGNRSCGAHPDNVSTYCLSEALVIEFARFHEGIAQLRETLKSDAAAEALRIQELDSFKSNSAAGAAEAKTAQAQLQQHLFEDFGAQIQLIDKEVEVAQRSLDQSLDAYQELQFALPLHIKYQQIIKSLSSSDGYIDKLSAIRRRVELYPFSFVDVTTPACN